MTALKEYQRLESLGLWKEHESAQRREVVVSFGAASLVLSSPNGTPLTHWSMGAVKTLDSKDNVAHYSPDPSSGETLEIEDAHMIEAIAKVRGAIRKSGPHPGRLRWFLAAILLGVIGFLLGVWLPSVSADYTARVLPPAQVSQIGQSLLTQTTSLTGQFCTNTQSVNALKKIEKWALPKGEKLHIVDMGARFSAHLPGGHILLNRILIEEYSGPEVAIGFTLMEQALSDETPPLRDLFHTLGTRATLTFLANGQISDTLLAEYAEMQLTKPLKQPDALALLARFKTVGVPSSPFAEALDSSGKTTRALISQDPVKSGYFPRIRDEEWIALQSICGDN